MRLIRRLAPYLVSLTIALLTAEVFARTWFAFTVGPATLLYGLRPKMDVQQAPPSADTSVQSHTNFVGDVHLYAPGRTGTYSKYFPHEQKLIDSPDRKTHYPVRINNHGFRGPDYEIAKAPGTVRVVTLGASSTFGYHDRDDETYPYYLDQILNASGKRPFEVINLGIPHSTSDNILALFRGEALPLTPDFATFYEGANDGAIVERGEPGVGARLWQTVRDHSLAAEFLNWRLGLGLASSAYAWSDDLAERRSRAFLENVALLADECHRHGVRLIVTTQQMKSELVPAERMHGFTYDDDVRLVRAMVARGELGPARPGPGFLRPFETLAVMFAGSRVILVHARMMDDLRAWAAGSDVGFVDLVHVLDQDRDLLINWVHLLPAGNHKIAEALAAEIERELDGGLTPRTPVD